MTYGRRLCENTVALKCAVIDPIITVAMIRAYQINIREIEPAMDLQEKLVRGIFEIQRII